MANRPYTTPNSGGFNSVTSLIIGLLFLVGLFFLARFVFNILYYLAPVLLIITLFIDHKVVVNYGKWVFNMLRQNPLLGIGLILLTIVGFPVVSIFLFGKAMLKKKINEVQKQYEQKTKGEYVEYEEVVPEEDLVELPPPPIRKKQKREGKNEYEDMFGDD